MTIPKNVFIRGIRFGVRWKGASALIAVIHNPQSTIHHPQSPNPSS